MGAGSTGAYSSIRIYKDLTNKGEHSIISEVKNINEGCFSLDFSYKRSQFAFTTPHRGIYVYDIKRKWLEYADLWFLSVITDINFKNNIICKENINNHDQATNYKSLIYYR